MDECFNHRIVRSSPDYTRDTVSRIHAEIARDDSIVTFPKLLSWLSAAAALTLLGFFGYQVSQKCDAMNSVKETGILVAKDPSAPGSPVTTPGKQEDSAADELPNLAMEELFLLAEDFEDAEFLLEEQVLDTLQFLEIL